MSNEKISATNSNISVNSKMLEDPINREEKFSRAPIMRRSNTDDERKLTSKSASNTANN